MTRLPILLVGAGGHARACIDVIEQGERFTVAGLVGREAEVGSEILGYKVLGTDDDLPRLAGEHGRALIAIGQIKTPEPRVRIYDRLKQIGCEMPAVVSPRGYLSPHATVGEGSIVMHGAIVNAGASVGANCIINSRALVEHDAVIADHCHIATGAALNSGVKVGSKTFIGSGTVVRQSVTIGEGCVVGMGERIRNDLVAGTRLPMFRGME